MLEGNSVRLLQPRFRCFSAVNRTISVPSQSFHHDSLCNIRVPSGSLLRRQQLRSRIIILVQPPIVFGICVSGFLDSDSS